MKGEEGGGAVPRMLRLPASGQVAVAAAAVLLAAGALGLLIWALASSRQLAWLTSISNVLAVDLAAWTVSAGMLAWVIRSRKPATAGLPAQASTPQGPAAGPVSETRGGQFGSNNLQVNLFTGETAHGHESGFRRIAAADGESPPGPPRAIRVRDAGAQARLLGVHQPVEVPGAIGDQPAYVLRDTDREPGGVRAEITKAARDSGLVVVVGDSSSGKTRTLLEAVTAEVPDWWLVQPRTVAEIDDLADDAPTRVVVWLDDLKSYLDAGLRLATVRELLKRPGPVVLVGTLWREQRRDYTAQPGSGKPDPHKEARGIIELATCVPLESRFSVGERARAEQLAAADPRIRAALAVGDLGLTQTMTAAPWLVTRWRDADPYAMAVIEAAIDATRLGASSPMQEDLLSAAARGYCAERARPSAPAEWFGAALEYTKVPVRGDAAILRLGSPPGAGMGEVGGYILAEYISQIGGQERAGVPPPAEFWEAALDHAGPADLPALARSARDRDLYRHAARLYKRAGSSLTAKHAVDLLELIHTVDRGGTRDTALWIAGNADLADPWRTGLLLLRLRQFRAGSDVLGAIVARAAERTSLRNTGSVSYMVAQLPREGSREAVSALADRIAEEVTITGKPLAYADEILFSLHERNLTRAVHTLAARIAEDADPDNAYIVSHLLKQMKGVGETSAAAAFAERAVEAIRTVGPEDVTSPGDIARLLDAMHEAGVGSAIAALLQCEQVTHVDVSNHHQVAELAKALRRVGAGEAAATLMSRVVTRTYVVSPHDAEAVLATLRAAAAGGLLTDAAARAAGQALLDHPYAVAGLMRAIVGGGQREAASAPATRDRVNSAPVDFKHPVVVAGLLRALRAAGAEEAVAELLGSRLAEYVDIDRHELYFEGEIARLSRVLGDLGGRDAVTALARRAADAVDLTDPGAITWWLEMMLEFGADPAFDTALLARNPGRHADLRDPAAVAKLLENLHRRDADDAIADIVARITAEGTDLTSPSAVARLLNALHDAGARPAIACVAGPSLAERVRLDDPDGIISLLCALHDTGSTEALTAVLGKNPVSNFDVSDPEAVSGQLSALHRIGARKAITALTALDPAAHVSLDEPHLVAGLLETLRQVGAGKQAESLADRAADHGIFSGPRVDITRHSFGRELDGRPSGPWQWRDLP